MSAFKGPWTVGRIVGSVAAFGVGTVGDTNGREHT